MIKTTQKGSRKRKKKSGENTRKSETTDRNHEVDRR